MNVYHSKIEKYKEIKNQGNQVLLPRRRAVTQRVTQGVWFQPGRNSGTCALPDLTPPRSWTLVHRSSLFCDPRGPDQNFWGAPALGLETIPIFTSMRPAERTSSPVNFYLPRIHRSRISFSNVKDFFVLAAVFHVGGVNFDPCLGNRGCRLLGVQTLGAETLGGREGGARNGDDEGA